MNLILFLSVPAGLMVTLGLPSLAIGMLFYFASYTVLHMKSIFKSLSIKNSYVHFLIVCSISIVLNIIPPYKIEPFFKSTFSFMMLILFFIAATFFISNLKKSLNIQNKKIVQNSYKFLFIIGFISLIGLTPTFVSLYSPKIVFPFLEPSHFTIVFSLISTTMLCISELKYRPYIILVTLFFAISFPSTLCLALFCMQILLLITSTKIFWRTFILLLIAAPLIFIYLDFNYYLSRITGGTDEVINLTNLVYLQGWESIIYSMQNTYGLGLGFQKMGAEYSGPIAELLCEVHYMCANNLDGSFFSAKLISEFGFIGICIALFFLYMSYRSMLIIRWHISEYDKGRINLKVSEIFGLCSLYVFSAELLLRGYGYFSPTFLIALYFVYLPLKYKAHSLRVIYN